MTRTDGLIQQPDASQPLRLVTLGATALVRPDGHQLLEHSKPLALLTFLAARPGRAAPRSRIAATFWGERDEDHARGSLRTTLNRLRETLGQGALLTDGSDVRLTLSLEWDRDEFLTALDHGDLEKAISLYTGPFFPDFADPGSAGFEHWAEEERARLAELFRDAAETLARRALDRGHATEAVRLANRIRLHAGVKEATWRLLLEALLAAGDEPSARSEAEACRAWLAGEGSDPEPRTRQLLRRVREGEGAATTGSQERPLVADLVGREREFSAVIQAWDQAQRGEGRHIHIEARSGLGKTRLLTDVGRRLAAQRARVVQLRANPGEQTLDFAFGAELARALGPLRGAVGVPQPSADVLVGYQRALGSVYPAAKPAERLDDPLLQRTQAVGEMLRAIADDAPVAILVDDVHWMDRASLHLLLGAAGRLATVPVLLVTAGRPDQRTAEVRASAETLTLVPLTSTDTEALLGSLGNLPEDGWGRELPAALRAATGGSPLLILETIKVLKDRGDLILQDGRWTSPDHHALLSRLTRVRPLEERLLALDAGGRHVLLLLAVAGTPLRSGVLLAGGEIATQAAVDDLLLRGLVSQTGGGFDLGHDEMREVLLVTAQPGEVVEAHATIGRALAREIGAPPEVLTKAARHLLAGRAWPELRAAYRQWVVRARRLGDRTAASTLAREFVGDTATPEEIKRLNRSLRPSLRLPGLVRNTSLAAAVVLAVAAALGWSALRAGGEVPDALLVLATGSPDEGLAIREVPLFQRTWGREDSIIATRGRVVARLPAGTRPYETLSPDPAGRRFAFDQVVSDSGRIDVFLREADGRIRRLTSTPGDDIQPSWAPDGRWLVIATARWTPRGDDDLDIAVVDPTTGVARQLTSGPDYDHRPQWATDGTRIAFARRRAADGSTTVCWITPDGRTDWCRDPVLGPEPMPVGWIGAGHLLIETAKGGHSDGRLLELDLEADTVSVVHPGAAYQVAATLDAAWLACACSETGRLTVFPRGRPALKAVVAGVGLQFGWPSVTAPDRTRRPFLDAVRLRRITVVRGIPHRLAVAGRDTAGRPVEIPPAVLRWWSSVPEVAEVSPSGTLDARGVGRVWVGVSAGGWRTDSVELTVTEPAHRVVQREDWTEGALGRWNRYGDPLPLVAEGPDGVRGLLNNGDGAFYSGAYARQSTVPDEGLGLEGLVSTPVDRPKWQRMRVGFIPGPVPIQGGLTGSAVGCVFSYPRGEGVAEAEFFTATVHTHGTSISASRLMSSGAWYRVRIQLFPDGTCGFAVDGIPVWRSDPVVDVSLAYHPFTEGQSVGTRMLVGPLEVWTGVKTDIRWEATYGKR